MLVRIAFKGDIIIISLKNNIFFYQGFLSIGLFNNPKKMAALDYYSLYGFFILQKFGLIRPFLKKSNI